MNTHLNAAIAGERLLDLQRAAGCCTPMDEHRRSLARPRRRFALRRRPLRPAGPVAACCA